MTYFTEATVSGVTKWKNDRFFTRLFIVIWMSFSDVIQVTKLISFYMPKRTLLRGQR
jgi:hypothetical protein